MTTQDIQTVLTQRYDRQGWLGMLHKIFPNTSIFGQPLEIDFQRDFIKGIHQTGLIRLSPDEKRPEGCQLAVIEVAVDSTVDLQRNRVGLRQLIGHFIDQDSFHGVLAVFVSGQDDYRFTFAAKESKLDPYTLELTTIETEQKRFTYVLGPNETCRTAAERFCQLATHSGEAALDDVLDAFAVEPLWKEFFSEYKIVFNSAEESIKGIRDADAKRFFTQLLFNRLLFLAFIQKKGWFKLDKRTDYLEALWAKYQSAKKKGSNFHRDFLQPLFFDALNEEDQAEATKELLGKVPYLNGGLFEKTAEDADESITVPDKIFEDIFEKLLGRFNFTVSESTPLDVEVAVDPEMLGKVFEELVTGRHDTGSYYTPKPIVSYMCREALRTWLATALPEEAEAALEEFVEKHEAQNLKKPEAVLKVLRELTVCDPACGSGAYLLGMLHELLDLREALFKSNITDDTTFNRKLEIIQNSVYGVDLDPFAVNIARLRLWLSLIVDFNGRKPPPLPNLEFKIGCGDSLTAPDPKGLYEGKGEFLTVPVREFQKLKAEFLTSSGRRKGKLRKLLAEQRDAIENWLSILAPDNAFNWAVEFAEVFAPKSAPSNLAGELNLGDELSASGEVGGFDIVLANPPYVRQELLGKEYKQKCLAPNYPEVYASAADLFVYFFARAHQLLRVGGISCFISSNKWLKANYGEKIRQHLLDAQAFHIVADFGQLPVFQAAVAYPCIFLWQSTLRANRGTLWATISNLDACYSQGVKAHIASLGEALPSSQFGIGKPRLLSPKNATKALQMERNSTPLENYIDGKICWGIKTGLNKAFIVDQNLRDGLIQQDNNSADILKRLVVGDDVRRYEIHDRNKYLVWTYVGIEINRYPAIFDYLSQFEESAKKRTDQGQQWWELRACAYYDAFECPKIIFPEMGSETRFAMDETGLFANNKCFIIPSDDWFLLAVLNSSLAMSYLHGKCSKLMGDTLEFKGVYMDKLPIPDGASAEKKSVAQLAKQAQELHQERRVRTEAFLKSLGIEIADSSSKNKLEQPWLLDDVGFLKKTRNGSISAFKKAKEETLAITEEIQKVEQGIDERVAALYGL